MELVAGRLLRRLALLSFATVPLTGCVESEFRLENVSRLPASLTPPPPLTRTDVTVDIQLTGPFFGSDSRLIMRDARHYKLAVVRGRTRCPQSYDDCQLTVKGKTEHILLRPAGAGETRAHFIVVDDPK